MVDELRDISRAYRLDVRRVKIGQLLVDPDNARLVTGSQLHPVFSPEDILQPSTQNRVLEELRGREHHVQNLVLSIKTKGFLKGAQPILVRSLTDKSGGEHFVVLEGNRRTAALKVLHGERAKLSPAIAKSIEEIEVAQIVHFSSSALDRQEVEDILLGTIHVDGPKGWGAWQKAVHVFRSYEREMRRKHRGTEFQYDTSIAASVGARFNMTRQAVNKMLTVYHAFRDLETYGFDVTPDSYHLIEQATSNRALRSEYFEFESGCCWLAETGVERLGDLCFVDDPVVHNPGLLKKFAFVFANGTPLDVENAEESSDALERAYERVSRRQERNVFRDSLESILADLNALRPADFRGSNEERRLIRKIQRIVRSRLGRLAG